MLAWTKRREADDDDDASNEGVIRLMGFVADTVLSMLDVIVRTG